MSIEIKKYVLNGFELSPIVGTVNLKDYYGYSTTFTASAAPTFQETRCATFFFYKNLTTNKIGLGCILDKHNNGNSGNFYITITGLPKTAELVVVDDGSEAKLENGTLTGKFGWADCCTDGFAIDNLNEYDELVLTITNAKGIDKLKFVNSDITAKYVSFSPTYKFNSTIKTYTINDYILLNPNEGSYFSKELDIEINYSEEVKNLIYGVDETPTIAKYIAYDNLNPPNPFIAVVQDGKGNVLFDGGFPKFYNKYWNNDWKVFSDMSASFKFLANAMDFIANPDKVSKGNKKILVLGDANSENSYCIKDTGTGDFNSSLNGVAKIQKYQLDFKVRKDYSSGMIDCSFEELDEYCAVILFSTMYSTTPYITDNAVKNLLLYRESGNGIFVITDHGINISSIDVANKFPYSGKCYFATANKLVTNFGVWFSGNYDRSDVNVGYLRKNYGDSPLYNNLDDSEYIHAGGSESRIFLKETKVLKPAELSKIHMEGDGYHKLNFVLTLTNGSVISRTYTYGLNVSKPFVLKDGNGNEITEGIIEIKGNTFDFDLIPQSNDSYNGFVKKNDKVIAKFENKNGKITYNFYDGYHKPIEINNGDIITFEITNPFEFTKSVTIKLFFVFDFKKYGRKLVNFTNTLKKDFGKKIINYPKYFAEFDGLKLPLKLKQISENKFDVTKPLKFFK